MDENKDNQIKDNKAEPEVEKQETVKKKETVEEETDGNVLDKKSSNSEALTDSKNDKKTKKKKKKKEKKPQTKSKKILKISLFSILGLLLTVVLALVTLLIVLWHDPVWQSHLEAGCTSLFDSKEQIKADGDKIKQDNRNDIVNAGMYIDENVELALENGSITPEQFTLILAKKLTLEEALAQNKGGNTEDMNTPPELNSDDVTDKPVDDSPQDPNDRIPPSDSPDISQNGNENEQGENTETPGSAEQKPRPPANTPNPPVSTPGETTDEKVASLVTKMYVLKNQYIGQINDLVGTMKAEYSQLPASQRTTSAKQTIASKYVSNINSMEAQCDAQVNAIVSELRQVLKSAGRDTTLADKILSTYSAEKENTKAYYISTYGD